MATKDITLTILDAPAGDVVIPTLTAADLYPVPATEVPGDRWTVELWVPFGDAMYQAEVIFWQASLSPAEHVSGSPFAEEMIADRRFILDRLEGTFKVWRCANAPGAVTHTRQFGVNYAGFYIAYRNQAEGPISPSSALMPWSEGAWQNVAEPPPDTLPGSPASTATRTALDAGWGIGFEFRELGSSTGVQSGQYWNGDWFVVNPEDGPGVRCTAATPNSVNRSAGAESGRRMHGMMLNPIINRTSYTDRADQGFDAAGSGNWMRRHTKYAEALNVNPNLKGDIVFPPGVEGSLYKARSLVDPTDTSRSCLAAFAIVTVVREVPPRDAFRPSPDRDVQSKASIATLAQLDSVTHPSFVINHRVQYSVEQTKRYLTGPFMSPALGARPNTSLYGRDQTFDKSDPLYNAVFAQAVAAAHAHIMDSRTSPADRRQLLASMVQIGLDILQANTSDRFEYSPAHSYSPWVSLFDMAETCVDNAAVRAAAALARSHDRLHERVLKQGRDETENGGNPGTSGVMSLRYITASDMWFRTPPEGLQAKGNWNKPSQTPFIPDQEWGTYGERTGGHIGMPFRGGSGSPNGGNHSNMNMSYTRLGMMNTLVESLVGAYRGPAINGVSVVSDIQIHYCDRIGRYMAAHWDPSDPTSLEGGPEWVNNNWTRWDQYMLQMWTVARAAMVPYVPIWTGQPEQPFPPLVTRQGSGHMRIVMLPTQIANGGTITRRQYRLRRVSASNFANRVTSNLDGSPATNETLRDLLFYNPSTPWSAWSDFTGTANLTGLQSGFYQVQVRLGSSLGLFGAASTNVPYRYDCGTAYGLPFGPRAVDFI